MPIDYSKYHPKWKLISRLIRKHRAKDCCEWCGLENAAIIHRTRRHPFYRYATTEEFAEYDRRRKAGQKMWPALQYLGLTRIVLTVAHLDRDKDNNRFWNLAALCQRCHLSHDILQHVRNRMYGRYHQEDHQLELELPTVDTSAKTP